MPNQLVTDYTRYYCKFHSDNEEHFENIKFHYQKILIQHLPLNTKIHILDIGCGMGFTLLTLQDMGYQKVEGIEIDINQVQSCLKKGLKVTQVDNTIKYLNENFNKYDLVLCLDVIEHIPHQEQLDFVKAIQIALKPQGKLICSVPNANSTLASRWRYNDWTHHISFTEHSIDFLLFNAGFDCIKIHETEFFHTPLKSWFSCLTLKRSFWKQILHWLLFRLVRALRRLEMIAELGWEQGSSIPLSLNLLAIAVKPS